MKSRNRGGVFSQGAYCPICGARYDDVLSHKCSPKVLAAIDAANTRASRQEDEPDDDRFLEPKLDERLAVGFAALNGEGKE